MMGGYVDRKYGGEVVSAGPDGRLLFPFVLDCLKTMKDLLGHTSLRVTTEGVSKSVQDHEAFSLAQFFLVTH